MAVTTDQEKPELPPADDATVQEILGYLNFSSGKPDAGFQRNLNRLFSSREIAQKGTEKEPRNFDVSRQRSQGGDGSSAATLTGFSELRNLLLAHLARLHGESPAFADCGQAEAVIRLVFDECLPAYRRHHADLLFHLSDEEFRQPFFVARVFEAVLGQGSPWDETGRIVEGALDFLNDFVGFRPLAVLENEQRTELYPHERFRPLPLYIRDAGVAAGKYHDLIEGAVSLFRETPAEILRDAHFDLSLMDELALDVRAHDHTHPVNKRTNYMFGEWDPHHIDTQGHYRRFVVRKIILDALRNWIDSHPGVPREELLYDASAVLCGTMLMASSISGSGPETHDSSVTLSSLLPKVARQRDAFYARLLQAAHGARARRLRREAKLTQQPFGHVRQSLNIDLARYGAKQVQYRHLAQLFAHMGNVQAAREEAAVIPSASVRFECEIQWRITAAHLHLDRSELPDALTCIREVEDHLQRGVECGALIDPWNILGFQGQFPLFSSREDSIPDQRAETLLEMMERTFGVYSRALSEAAAQGDSSLLGEFSHGFRRLADEWDRYATTTVEDLPPVSGQESWESAAGVSRALSEWRSAGEAAGDISFWRRHVDEFQSAKAYAQVVEALLERRDHVAARGLLMQWLSQADDVGLESGPHSIHALLVRWMHLVTGGTDEATRRDDSWSSVRRLFDFLEANAGDYWSVPTLEEAADAVLASLEEELPEGNGFDADAFDEEEFEEDEEEPSLFEAAYDDVVFRDSAQDGSAEDTLDGGFAPLNTEFEIITRQLEPRLKFLNTLAELWQIAAAAFASQGAADGHAEATGPDVDAGERQDVLRGWYRRTLELQRDLNRLMKAVEEYEISAPAGDLDSNVEYDAQLQSKFYLSYAIITTDVSCRTAEQFLLCCLPEQPATKGTLREIRALIAVYRGILRRDVPAVQASLPRLREQLAKKPLLYISLENGGDPRRIFEVRILQAAMRFLLSQLPRLGLLREAWQLVRTAYRMERGSRPEGMGLAITEFDRLFRIALRSSLECVIGSSAEWRPPRLSAACKTRQRSRERRGPGRRRRTVLRPRRVEWEPGVGPARRPAAKRLRRRHAGLPAGRDEALVRVVGEIVERYLQLWLKHSGSLRLSPVEGLKAPSVWRSIKDFISRYGADLFHPRMLMMGNLRAILHNGIEPFLDYLDESQDPLHPTRLIEDLDSGIVDDFEVIESLELIYGSVVDKYERFVEYNTTTTQSDYGEMLYCLLDFLRTEAAYERTAWNLIPLGIAHELLSRSGKHAAAQAWKRLIQFRTGDTADRHLKELRAKEKKYGMCLPSLTDHLNERFVKLLSVNRMLALIPRAMEDARLRRRSSASFAELRREIEMYLESTSGSAIDVPAWLRTLEKEVHRLDARSGGAEYVGEWSGLDIQVPPVRLSLEETRRQLKVWDDS